MGLRYTPFETGQRAIRPKQAYLTKLPADLVEAFPSLSQAADFATATRGPATAPRPSATPGLGEEYRRPDESVLVSEADPYSRDPALVERALRSHAATQNALADFLEGLDVQPRSPRADEPNYDLSWSHEGAVYVTEIKSLSATNEERQLRLALGQVLRYRQAMGRGAVAIIATSREPTDNSWKSLLSEFGVVLVWPGQFEVLEGLIEKS